ncbi:hypothetical protein FTO70_10585 [Methanosarcina sp. KYL-1]|uniref:hypothetical protein n=1 Tax=Methanosarcina sp. KYL-1 TaxID=2602068 RepID=UPI002101C164|nr:hypothetical protein [Methanosarcina sp. KYL-1]MCQ1536117.1 hypothetical protein [Methanosarcina sp. KYL-1]
MQEEGTETDVPDEEIPVIPVEPNPFWKQNAEKLVGESISSIEDTARQFVVITSLLQGIYFHAIAFSDLRVWSEYSVLIYVAPLFLWLLSLSFAVLVFFRRNFKTNINSTQISRETFEKIVKEKCWLVQVSGVALIFSFAALLVAFLHYLGLLFA